MAVHTVSSRDFTRDIATAKRFAADGPVFITDRGRPAFALLKIDDYYKIAGSHEPSLLDVMNAIPCGPVEFEPARVGIELRAPDLD